MPEPPEQQAEPARQINVREAVATDDDALAALFVAYHDEHRHELGDQDVADEGRTARARFGDALLVATSDGGVAGCVAYLPWGPGRCRMTRMYVMPSQRGRGIGQALARAVMRAAKEAGYDEMVLDTSRPMQAATRLYRHLGFEDVDPDWDAPCRDAVYLGTRL